MNFNPRSREGSDRDSFKTVSTLLISIRAPARGATNIVFRDEYIKIFQSALPRGERHRDYLRRF